MLLKQNVSWFCVCFFLIDKKTRKGRRQNYLLKVIQIVSDGARNKILVLWLLF